MECYQNSRNRARRVCGICGKELLATPSQLKKGGGRFCSLQCFGKWYSKHRSGINNYYWKGGGGRADMPQTCGKKFSAKPSAIKRGNAKFCSRECVNEWMSDHCRGANCPTWKGGKIKRICEICGKEFLVSSSQIKREAAKFCSYNCYYEGARGDKSFHWKGGLSFEPYCSKFNSEFKDYIRDKFGRICFLCSKTEKENEQRLSVHHVNYDKSCLCNDNLTCQFVPLCRSCNTKVNSNRDMWEKKIKNEMRNKLNGWYI